MTRPSSGHAILMSRVSYYRAKYGQDISPSPKFRQCRSPTDAVSTPRMSRHNETLLFLDCFREDEQQQHRRRRRFRSLAAPLRPSSAGLMSHLRRRQQLRQSSFSSSLSSAAAAPLSRALAGAASNIFESCRMCSSGKATYRAGEEQKDLGD